MDAALAAGVTGAKGATRSGMRLGLWLTAEEAGRLLAIPAPNTLKGVRDAAVLALLLGGGLRRSEVAALNCDHLQCREGRWLIGDLVGKHGRIRSVPIPRWARTATSRWLAAACITEGPIFRPVPVVGK